MNTYKKMKNGVWGMRLEGEIVSGERVTVTKKDGSLKEEVVGKILWQGSGAKGQLVSFAYIERHNIARARALALPKVKEYALSDLKPKFASSAPVARTRDALALVAAYEESLRSREALAGGRAEFICDPGEDQDREPVEGRRHDQ